MKIIKDITNWFFLKKVIKENEKTLDWQKYNLRVDWINRIYTVIEINENEVKEDTDLKYLEITELVLEKTKPINNYLTMLNLAEIVGPTVEKIENTNSWLLVYHFLWKFWNWKKLAIITSFLVLIILFFIYKAEILNLFI
jgi:hypothetical protein